MAFQITRDSYNPLLKRREISFLVEHTLAATPKLYDVRKNLADRFGVHENLVFVRRLKTPTGTMHTIGEAEIYDSAEDAKTVVPEYILLRNMAERHKEKPAKTKKEVPSKKGPSKK
jgi:small subunit ribosomal protein S24e